MSIPKIIFQISINKPEKYIIDFIDNYFEKWDYYNFNDDEMINYLKNNPLKEFENSLEKFNSLKIPQHKTDFFRYYFLYINGGVYLDSDAMVNCNIEKIIKDYDGVFIKSNFFNFTNIFNGFICIIPKHKIMYDALKHIHNIDFNNCDYMTFCNQLLNILLKNDLDNIKIYDELLTKQDLKKESIVYHKNEKILTHYFQNKIIPKNHRIKLNIK